MADEHDRVALLGEAQRLDVDLRHQRAGRVDRLQAARLRVGAHAGRDAVRGEDGHRPLRAPRSPARRRSRRARAAAATTCLLCTISLRTYTGGPCSSSARSTVCTARSTPAQYPRGAASRIFSTVLARALDIPAIVEAARAGTLSSHAAASPRQAHRRRRLLPAPGGTDLAHARRRADDPRRPAAVDGGVPRTDPPAAAPGAALPPQARPYHTALDSGRPVWVDDPSFNLEYHVRHTALPAPGGWEQLHSLTARIFSQQLDRSKPLWEMWLIEGLEDDRFALISKTHHSLIDGIAGIDLATVLFDLSPDPPPLRHSGRAWQPHREPGVAGAAGRRPAGRAARRGRAGGGRARRARAPRPRAGPRARGGGGDRRDRLGRSEPRAGDAAERRHRPAPALRRGRQLARGLQARQERLRVHRQRRRARGGRGRAALLSDLPRGAHRGPGDARARAGVGARRGRARPGRQPHRRDARTAAGLHRRPGAAPAVRLTRDGRPEGVKAGARRGGDRRRAELRAADDPRAGLAPELLHAPVQPDRHERPRPAVPAVRAGPRDARGLPGRVPAPAPRAGDRDHVLQRPDELRPAGRLRRAAGHRLDRREHRRGTGDAGLARARGRLRRRPEPARGLSSRARTSRPRSSAPATTAA